jgi:hypothetical protein
MKKLGLILICLMLFSCFENEQEFQEKMGGWKDYAVIVIDSCEYIVKSSANGSQGYGYMAHKGNCRYCKERMVE